MDFFNEFKSKNKKQEITVKKQESVENNYVYAQSDKTQQVMNNRSNRKTKKQEESDKKKMVEEGLKKVSDISNVGYKDNLVIEYFNHMKDSKWIKANPKKWKQCCNGF